MNTRGSLPTPPVTAGPTSSASATPASTSRGLKQTAPTAPSSSSSTTSASTPAAGVDQHPRFLADTTGDGRADIVGFGNAGVYVSRPGRWVVRPVQLVVNNFGFNAGGWRVDQHPRSSPTRPATAAPTSSASATPASTCPGPRRMGRTPQLVVSNFGFNAGGWRTAPAVPRRHHGRRPRRHRRLRQRRRLRLGPRPTARTARPARRRELRVQRRRLAGPQHRGSSPTRPATVAPTSSASATPASTCRGPGRRLVRPRRAARDELRLRRWRAGSPAPATARRHHRRWPAADVIGFGNAGCGSTAGRRRAHGGRRRPGQAVAHHP